MDYRAAWLPSEPGTYVLTVDVDPVNTMGDSQRANNKATVTITVAWRKLNIIPWGQTRHLRWTMAVAQEFPANRTDRPALDYWHHRGVRVLGYIYTIERNLMKLSEQKMTRHTVRTAGRYEAAGADGLIIDETGSSASRHRASPTLRYAAAGAWGRD